MTRTTMDLYVPPSPPPSPDYYASALERIDKISAKIQSASYKWAKSGLLIHLDQSRGDPLQGGGTWSRRTLKGCYVTGIRVHREWAVSVDKGKRKALVGYESDRETKRMKMSFSWADVERDINIGDDTGKNMEVNTDMMEEYEDDIPKDEKHLVLQKMGRKRRRAATSISPLHSVDEGEAATSTRSLSISASSKPSQISSRPVRSSPLVFGLSTVHESSAESSRKTSTLDHSQASLRIKGSGVFQVGVLRDTRSTISEKLKFRQQNDSPHLFISSFDSKAVTSQDQSQKSHFPPSDSLDSISFSPAKEQLEQDNLSPHVKDPLPIETTIDDDPNEDQKTTRVSPSNSEDEPTVQNKAQWSGASSLPANPSFTRFGRIYKSAIIQPLQVHKSSSKSSFRKILASQGHRHPSSSGGSRSDDMPVLSGVNEVGDSYSQFQSQVEISNEIEGFLENELSF